MHANGLQSRQCVCVCADNMPVKDEQNTTFFLRTQISTRRPDILTETIRSFPQFLHENTEIVHLIRPWPLPSKSFPIRHSLIPSFDAA
jgi:hypothetical protein